MGRARSGGSKAKWTLYEKPGCPACKNAKDIFAKYGVKYKLVNGVASGKTATMDGEPYRWWPKIYHGRRFVGGRDRLEAALRKAGHTV